MNNFKERKKYFEENFKGEKYSNLLNMIEELIIAEISKNEFAMKDICKIYDEYINDENQYMGLALETYDMMNVYLMSGKDSLAPTMVVALFAYSNKNDMPEIIDVMLKKSFKKEYRSVQANMIKCDEDSIYRYKENIICFYIASLLNVDYKDLNYTFKLNVLYSVSEVLKSFSTIAFAKRDDKEIVSEMSGVLNEFGINKNKSISYEGILIQIYKNKVRNSISSMKSEEKNSLVMLKRLVTSMGNDSINQLGTTIDDLANPFNATIKNELSKSCFKYFDFISSVISKTVRCSKDIEMKELTSEELIHVLGVTAHSAGNRFDDEELPQLFLIAFIIKVMGDTILDYAKSLVLATVEKVAVEHDSAVEKDKIAKQYYRVKEEGIKKQLEINNLKEELELLRKENSQLKAQINRFKSKKEKEYANKKEIESLRRLFFELEHEEVDEGATERDIYDDRKDIAFVGSNISLHTKIKNMFPNFTYISANECSRDLNFIKKYDKVFIHTHIPHAMYYKVLSLIENLDIDLIFLNETNSEILGRKILSQIKKD